VELGRGSIQPPGVVEARQAEHVLVQRHVLAQADDRVNAIGLELTEPPAINEAAVHQQPAEGARPPGLLGGRQQLLALGQIAVFAGAANGEVPQQGQQASGLAQTQNAGLPLHARALEMAGRHRDGGRIQHRRPAFAKLGALLQEVRGQRQLVLLQLPRLQGVEEVGQGLRIKGPLGAALVETLVDLAQVEAQAAQDIGRVEEHGADLGQAVEPKEGLVQQRVAEELRADGAALAAIGELLEEAQDAALAKELGEVIHELAGRRQQAITLAALQGRDHGGAVLAHQAPGGPDGRGRHGTLFLKLTATPPA
jgi:hypothetical protein